MSLPIEERGYRYIVITPARNEAEYLPETIRSMAAQTVKPIEWVIVNDGSSDGTRELIEAAAAEHPWITAIHNQPQCESGVRGDRAIAAKEIVAFHKGMACLRQWESWDFLVKLDADVGFAPDYFARCLDEFEKDPSLGLGGGTVVNKVLHGFETESHPSFHVRGATKIYRRRCWEEMGGIPATAGWDTLDEVKANRLRWKTRTFPSIEIVHYRATGAANGAWKNGIKNGRWSYQIGYHPMYLLLRSGRQLLRRPYLTGAIALVAGYCQAGIQGAERLNEELARYVWEQQWNRMLGRPSIWR